MKTNMFCWTNDQPLELWFDAIMKGTVGVENGCDLVDTREHLPLLRKMSHGNVLEIGTDVGYSTLALLLGVKENGGHVWSVDINPNCADTHKGNPDWTFINADSTNEVDWLLEQGPQNIDVLYVDGGHSYQEAKVDIHCYGRLVKHGGCIIVHDVLHPQFPGVRKAFDEYQGFEAKEIYPGSFGMGVIHVDRYE